MTDAPVIIEVALNGGTPKSRNPNVPRSPQEIAEDAVRCIDAGATIVHNHNDDRVVGGPGVHAWDPYLEAWRLILRERPGTILYPTMAGGGAHVTVEQRYSHVVKLAEEGVLGLGLVDPGSVNFGGVDEDGLPAAVDVVYQNTFRDARYMFEACARLGVGASISIFEPGFLRVVLAYHRAGRLPRGAFVKLYFGGEHDYLGGTGRGVGFGLPPTRAALEAYLEMLQGCDVPWAVAVLGGDVIECGLARLALEHGGHLRVGLEDYAGPRQPRNAELVAEAVALVRQIGKPVASCVEAARVLGLPRG